MQRHQWMSIICVWLRVVGMWRPSTAAGQTTSHNIRSAKGRAIELLDVFVLTLLLRQELDPLRAVLLRPKERRSLIQLRNTQPREVFFQALILCRKANQLSCEFTRESKPLPAPPQTALRLAHVWKAVRADLGRIEYAKVALEIEPQQLAPPLLTQPRRPRMFLSLLCKQTDNSISCSSGSSHRLKYMERCSAGCKIPEMAYR